jgi:hypothetical protein
MDPDQQRITPQTRRSAQHPGHASLVVHKVRFNFSIANFRYAFAISRRKMPE